MLYLGIDQHARQLTISLRDDSGDVLLARQVSTRPEKINEFFQRLTRERLRNDEQFIAVVEVCGFNDWLIRMLRDYQCQQSNPHPTRRTKESQDGPSRRGRAQRSLVGQPRIASCKANRSVVCGKVDIANTADQENRRLTTLRKDAGRAKTRLILQIKHMLRRHNLQWEMPTKTFPTKAAIAWLSRSWSCPRSIAWR